MAKRNVVIVKDTKGDVCYVAEIKSLDENEINKLVNKCSKYHQRKEQELFDMKSDIETLEKKCEDLQKEVNVLKGEE